MKLNKLLLLLLIFSMLSGCVFSYENRIAFHDNGSVDVELKLTVDKVSYRKVYPDLPDEELFSESDIALRKAEFESNGFDVTTINNTTEFGFIISQSHEIAAGTPASGFGVGQFGMFNAEQDLFAITDDAMTVDFFADLDWAELVGSDAKDLTAFSIDTSSTAKFVIDFPKPISNHNASFISNDSMHLEWDLVLGENNKIFAVMPFSIMETENTDSIRPGSEAEELLVENPNPSDSTSIVDIFIEDWEYHMTERNDDGRLRVFDKIDIGIYNFFGVSTWEWKENDSKSDRVKKSVLTLVLKSRLYIVDGYAELASWFGGE